MQFVTTSGYSWNKTSKHRNYSLLLSNEGSKLYFYSRFLPFSKELLLPWLITNFLITYERQYTCSKIISILGVNTWIPRDAQDSTLEFLAKHLQVSEPIAHNTLQPCSLSRLWRHPLKERGCCFSNPTPHGDITDIIGHRTWDVKNVLVTWFFSI
jgi:hypothetical protein